MPAKINPQDKTCPVTGLTVGSAAFYEHALEGALRSLDPDCGVFVPFVGYLAQKIARLRQDQIRCERGVKS